MSDPLLSVTVKTNVTKETSEALEAIAKARGDGIKVTQVLRDAIREYIANHSVQAKKK